MIAHYYISLYASFGYTIMIIVDSCIFWFHLDCIMPFKVIIQIATNACSRKSSTAFGDISDCWVFDNTVSILVNQRVNATRRRRQDQKSRLHNTDQSATRRKLTGMKPVDLELGPRLGDCILFMLDMHRRSESHVCSIYMQLITQWYVYKQEHKWLKSDAI